LLLARRVLVQAEVGEEGGQSYRARFLLGQLAGRRLDVELPIPAAAAGLQVLLNGKRVAWSAVDETGQASEGGRAARLLLNPNLVRESSILEVRYHLLPGRGGTGLLQTPLQPPVLRGDPGRVPTRWEVTVPANWVTVSPEGGPGSERVWGRRGWLLAPRLAVTSADLERWFAGTESAAVALGSPARALVGGTEESEPVIIPSLVCWQNGLAPIVLTHVPQQAWLMLCSLGLLLVGLLLYGLLRFDSPVGTAAWFWAALVLLALAVAVAGLLWPAALAAVAYGCEPGAAVLLLFALVQWLLHERYRRQVVFLPSFSRVRSGSSLTRAGSAPRPHGEPSTVDAPPPVLNSNSSQLDGSSRKEAMEDQGSKLED
jgi:hypothetical protein